jgi:fatty-acyl-CoA synthase
MAYVELVPDAEVSAADIAAFAAEHITERAATPKDVVIIDRMPLTDIGKPDKVTLRFDAAKRAFSAALRDALGPDARLDVTVGPHATHGTTVGIGVAGAPADADARARLEAAINAAMQPYPHHYAVRWK